MLVIWKSEGYRLVFLSSLTEHYHIELDRLLWHMSSDELSALVAGRPLTLFLFPVDDNRRRESMHPIYSSRICLRLVAACMIVVATHAACATDSPNIILIFTDDQAWNGTSVAMDPNNPNSKSDFYQTPALEQLASQGMRFSNAYSAAAVCSPTRAALVTGKSPAAINYQDIYYDDSVRGFGGHPLTPPQVVRLDPNQVGIAERVKQANADYATALIGKWHLSGASPHEMGFDSWDELRFATSPSDPKGIMARSNAAVDFVEAQVAANKPFFLELSEFALHTPIRPTPENLAKYGNLPPGTRHTSVEYAAYTEDLDAGIGNLLDRVDALGIRDNTYVIFASDNGSAKNDSSSTPLYSGKKSIFEGGIRSPFLISGPGIQANSHSAVPITTMDIYSTVSDLAGNTMHLDKDIEGASLKGILNNGGTLPNGVEHLHRAHSENGAIYFISPANIATGPSYRLRPMAAVRQGDYKLIRVFGENGVPDSHLLFDVNANVTESETTSSSLNLANDFPDVTAELTESLDYWIRSADVPLPYDVAAPVSIQWRSNRLKGHRGEEAGGQWRSVSNVNQKFRETWYEPDDQQVKPTTETIQRYQRGLPDQAYHFDGNDQLAHQFFHVSNGTERVSNRRFSTGEADFDRSVSYEFWVRLDDLDDDHMLFETGSPNQGLSVTIGDSNNDTLHREARFRLVGADGKSISVTGDIAQFADATKDFVHLSVVYNDDPNDRYAEIYANGHSVARTQGLPGTENSIYWDPFVQGFEDSSLGHSLTSDLGASGGVGDLPFSGAGLRGEISVVNYHNHSISPSQVLNNYNDALDPVGLGIVSTSGNAMVPATRPSSVALGSEESTIMLVIEERRDQLSDVLSFDFISPSNLSGSLVTGEAVTSYLVHFDPIGSDVLTMNSVSGTITFDQAIQGLLLDSSSLTLTDSILGSIGDYGADSDRGLTIDANNTLTISGDGRTLFFDLQVSGDELLQFRVVTDDVGLDPADLNFDLSIDNSDLAIWNSGYSASTNSGDINVDGFTDGQDFLAWQTSASGFGQAGIAPVPEPGSLLLLLGTLPLLMVRQRKLHH